MTLTNDFQPSTALENPEENGIEFNLEAWERNDQEPLQDYAEFFRRCLDFHLDRSSVIGRLLLTNRAKSLGITFEQAIEAEVQVCKRIAEREACS